MLNGNNKFKVYLNVGVLVLMTTLSSVVFADSIIIPPPYSKGENFTKDGKGLEMIKEVKDNQKNDVMVYLYGELNQQRQDPNSFWLTQCSHVLINGLKDFRCILDQKGVHISITPGETFVYFNGNSDKFDIKEITYKIDNKPTVTNKYGMIVGRQPQAFLDELLIANKFSYSWKEGTDNKSHEINLTGLSEAYSFAIYMIAANKQSNRNPAS